MSYVLYFILRCRNDIVIMSNAIITRIKHASEVWLILIDVKGPYLDNDSLLQNSKTQLIYAI